MGDGEAMGFPDRRSVNVLLTILLFAVAIAILYAARRIFLIFVFAILFAYLIDPVVRFLQRHSLLFKNLRGPHVVEAYLAFLILAALALHGVAPQISRYTTRLFKEGPVLVDKFTTGEIATEIGERYGWSEAGTIRLKSFLVSHREETGRLVSGGEKFASDALAVLVIVPILAIFFLADGGHLADAVIQLVSTDENRQTFIGVADELNDMLRRYIRAKVTLGGASALFYCAALLLLGCPHAIGLGILGGILEFIPVAGWMISAATIVGVGIFTHCHWIWMAALLGIWRIAMDYFISPRILGQNLEIHPLMVIFGVMVGGEIGGIVGIYLSIPLMVVIRVIWRRFVSRTALVEAPREMVPVDGSE
jgi:predicted PurR-regulated permease PerM